LNPWIINILQFEAENKYNCRSGGSGCGFDTATLSTADYTTVTPNAKLLGHSTNIILLVLGVILVLELQLVIDTGVSSQISFNGK
jgi:hypothetical protein